MAETLFHTDSSHLIGRHIGHVIPSANAKELQRALEKAIEGQTSELEVVQDPDISNSRTLAVVISPVLDDDRNLLGLAAWARDISNRKILQRQLIQAEKMVSLGTLASGVAHHFNNIIAGVATFVDYALNCDNPQSSRRALQMTAEAANRISHITKSLLTFAEKDVREFDLSDLTEVVLTFCHLVEKPLREKHIELKLDLNVVPVYEVPGSRMHQVLGNLLDNAERAMPEGGKITICLRSRGNYVELMFTDSGCGISNEDLPHIFEPFFTTQGTSSGGNLPCAGLGLSVVHGIVGELGGDTRVASKVGQGTTFVLRFPLPKEDKKQ